MLPGLESTLQLPYIPYYDSTLLRLDLILTYTPETRIYNPETGTYAPDT